GWWESRERRMAQARASVRFLGCRARPLVGVRAIHEDSAIAVLNAYVRVGLNRVNVFENFFEHAVVRATAAAEQHQQRNNYWAKLGHVAGANRTSKFYQEAKRPRITPRGSDQRCDIGWLHSRALERSPLFRRDQRLCAIL